MGQQQSQPAETGHGSSISQPQLAAVFAALPDAIIVSDPAGKILTLNAAALALFEIQANDSWSGMPLQAFLQRYEWWDEYYRPAFFAPWLLDFTAFDRQTAPRAYEQTLRLHLPSQGVIFLESHCSPLLDEQGQAPGRLLTFHEIAPRYQKALHLQRVYEAVATLNEAIARLPESQTFTFPDENILLSPPFLSIAQQLVDAIRQVLACWRVSLVGRDAQSGCMLYVAGSGFTAEQEQQRREVRGRFLCTDVVDQGVRTALDANQEVIIRADQLHVPVGHPADFDAAMLLGVPLFLEQQRVGALIIVKQGWDSTFSQEEIELARAVATQAMLVIECLVSLQEQADKQARELVQHEIQRLGRDFLTLASHELRTPLTGIKGNLQLAQRRLGLLKGHLAEQSEYINAHLEHARQSLEQAEQSTRLQERMVQNMIDDARIQAGQLTLTLKLCELLGLVRASIARQQASAPERVIEMEILTTAIAIPVLADAGRIDQVLSIYLANALDYSPAEQPVRVQVEGAEGMVRVSVHDKGPGISPEEQVRLWDRFYRAKGSAVQHELDLSLGLSFYLCQALIERHHGNVGVASTPGSGATFWFTLPLAGAPERA